MGKKCVVVEGITDYWLLKALDAVLAIRHPDKALDTEIILVPAGGTSRLMPLASLMYGAAGVKGKNMLVLLDSDTEGANAKKRLETDLFVADSRVIPLGSVLNMPKATVEDFVERATYAAALNDAGYAIKLDAAEQEASCNVDACSAAFKRLGLGEFDHIPKTRAALRLADRWAKEPNAVEQTTIDKVAALFKVFSELYGDRKSVV